MDNGKEALKEKNLELNTILQKEQILFSQFSDLVSENDSNRNQLYKMFTKKEKYYGDKDEYYSDEEDGGSDDSCYDNDDEVYVCPESCPRDIYDGIIELREKRIRMEYERKLFLRQLKSIERSHSQVCSKLEQSENNLEEIRRQIQHFESKKLKALNEIAVKVPITTNQIHVKNDSDNRVSSGQDFQLGEYVVFSNAEFVKLIQRCRDISQEVEKEENVVKNLQVDLKRRMKENDNTEESITNQKKRLEELQMLKFGQKIDIDRLDKLTETSSTSKNSSHHLDIEKAANKYEKEMKEIETKNLELKKELKKVTDENTRILNEIAKLSKCQMTLEKDLQTSHGKVTESEDEEKASDSEISHLKEMVVKQRAEKKILQQEINRLKRKDGKSYTLQSAVPTSLMHVLYPFQSFHSCFAFAVHRLHLWSAT